jgi:hypothetical protein
MSKTHYWFQDAWYVDDMSLKVSQVKRLKINVHYYKTCPHSHSMLDGCWMKYTLEWGHVL